MKVSILLLCVLILKCLISIEGFASVSVSASAGILGGTAIYYMLTQTNRGTLGQILASRRCPLLENGTDDKLLYIDTNNWDGETKTTVSGLLYYFSILVSVPSKFLIEEKKNITLPWGEFDMKNDPLSEVKKIRDYLDSISGGFFRLNLTNVELWNLYPLGVVRTISENRDKTINLVEESISNTINKATNAIEKKNKKKNKKMDNNINTLNNQNNQNNNNNNKKVEKNKTRLSDMIYIPHRRSISSRSPIHANVDNSKVHYEETPWKPINDTSWEELRSIYVYLKDIIQDRKVLTKENVISINKDIERFSLAFVLYLRERQFDISSIDPINYDSSKFRKSLGAFERSYAAITDIASLSHGRRNSIKVVPWKLIPDSMWKNSPFQSFERVVFSIYSDEIKKVKYNSLNWNVYDFTIGVVFNTFSRDIGLPNIFGQYIEKKSVLKRLYSRNPLKLRKYDLENGYYTEVNKSSKSDENRNQNRILHLNEKESTNVLEKNEEEIPLDNLNEKDQLNEDENNMPDVNESILTDKLEENIDVEQITLEAKNNITESNSEDIQQNKQEENIEEMKENEDIQPKEETKKQRKEREKKEKKEKQRLEKEKQRLEKEKQRLEKERKQKEKKEKTKKK